MTQDEIRKAIREERVKHHKRIVRIGNLSDKEEQRHKEALEAIQSKCRHRKRTQHWGYEMPSYETCDICEKEIQ
jgi:ribosome-binding ATPase YchF (GTP1/OBG family)